MFTKIFVIFSLASAGLVIGQDLIPLDNNDGPMGPPPAPPAPPTPPPFNSECQINLQPYLRDAAPVTAGLSAGEFAPGRTAYVGVADGGPVLVAGRLTTSPPGLLYNGFFNDFPARFTSKRGSMWFLRPAANHQYAWINSPGFQVIPFAVDIGTKVIGSPIYVVRVTDKDGFVSLGTMPVGTGFAYVVNKENKTEMITSGFQVLTCQSNIANEVLTIYPTTSISGPVSDTGCSHDWEEYKNNDKPSIPGPGAGINAGDFDCKNPAFVGKTQTSTFDYPGRIQIVNETGLYTAESGKQIFVPTGSFYLKDNPAYTYDWVVFDNVAVPPNVVQTRSTRGAFSLPIIRVKLDNHVRIGYYAFDSYGFVPSYDGKELDLVRDFEFLVCDPIPQYQCVPDWKKYTGDAAPSTEGVEINVHGLSTGQYIGRGTRKCTNGCDYEIGRIKITDGAGAYYIDDFEEGEVFDNTTAEFMVLDRFFYYRWVTSKNGERVANGLEIQKEGNRPFYIGATLFDTKTVIGKVRPGQGLFFIDPTTGEKRTTNVYNVLTCKSPVPKDKVYYTDENRHWFGAFGCPPRKQWSFRAWACVCKPELKGLYSSPNAVWSDDTCSYSKI